MAEVTLTIAGRNYRMACDDGQETHLTELGALVDQKIADMRASFGEIGDMRLAVMAAIVVADELAGARRQIASLDERLGRLSNPDARTLAASETEIAEAVELLDHLSERLEILAADLRTRVKGAGAGGR